MLYYIVVISGACALTSAMFYVLDLIEGKR